MQASPGVITYLFTDIEGSTRLWEAEPEGMRRALARHDEIARGIVQRQGGVLVKTTGDGIHAVFDDPSGAILAAVSFQQALTDPQTTAGITLKVRCGVHAGVDERRDNDFYGPAVNRAARIMSVAHGGQVLLSQTVAALLQDKLPAELSLRDLGSVRLRDLARPERIYQVVHPRLRADFPALRSLEATPNNLPQQLTSFIGREEELADIRKGLRTSRLLTLVGVGGIGKTRLSLQTGADLLDDFPDGVWFVELAAITDALLVPQAVASVLGVKEEAGRAVIDALEKYVRDRRLLLIMDNCEHLVRACAELARRLLEAGTGIKIVASSREPLHVRGESIYQVPALAIPGPSATTTPETLAQYESVRLFLERAVAAQPEFRATERNAAALAEISRKLDGIPLAIELAAARIRTLSVEAIVERLSDRFRLLTRGDRTALPRQQTLRALIDWSHDLLDPDERAVLRRLAVFAGGWTVEAAEAVCAAGAVHEADLLDLLTNLAEKSLVVVEPTGRRYALLETVGQYARERLKESGEEEQARTRHLGFYLTLAERARPELVGPNQAAWLARLDLERENILAAHAWCARAEDGASAGLKLAHYMLVYYVNRGLLGLGHRVTVEALARPGAQGRTSARCRGLFNAGQLDCWMGRYRQARSYLEESLTIARELGDKQRIAMVLQPLGAACLGQGDGATARVLLQEARALAEELGNKRELAAALNALAQLHRVEGELDAAEALYRRVVALARELDDRESIAIGLLNLAMVVVGRGSSVEAASMLLEVLGIAKETGSKPVEQSILEVAAGLAAVRSEWVRSARFYGAAESRAAQTGLHRDAADEAFLMFYVARTRGALSAAEFAAAEAAGRALSNTAIMDAVRTWLESTGPARDPPPLPA